MMAASQRGTPQQGRESPRHVLERADACPGRGRPASPSRGVPLAAALGFETCWGGTSSAQPLRSAAGLLRSGGGDRAALLAGPAPDLPPSWGVARRATPPDIRAPSSP